MAQIHKLEDQRGRKCSGEKFYEIFRKKANLLPQICPDLVKDIKVLKGDWESKDSTKQWTIVVAGKLPEVDVMAESADDDNKSYTYIVIDGEIKKHYIFLKTTFKVTTNPIHSLDHGCWVKLTIEYEPNPHSREKPVNQDIEDHALMQNHKAFNSLHVICVDSKNSIFKEFYIKESRHSIACT